MISAQETLSCFEFATRAMSVEVAWACWRGLIGRCGNRSAVDSLSKCLLNHDAPPALVNDTPTYAWLPHDPQDTVGPPSRIPDVVDQKTCTSGYCCGDTPAVRSMGWSRNQGNRRWCIQRHIQLCIGFDRTCVVGRSRSCGWFAFASFGLAPTQ